MKGWIKDPLLNIQYKKANELTLFRQNRTILKDMVNFLGTTLDLYQALRKEEAIECLDMRVYLFVIRLYERLRFDLCIANKHSENLYNFLNGIGRYNKKNTESKRRFDLFSKADLSKANGEIKNMDVKETISVCMKSITQSKFQKSTVLDIQSNQYEKYQAKVEKEMRERGIKGMQMRAVGAEGIISNQEFVLVDKLLLQADKLTGVKGKSLRQSPMKIISKYLSSTKVEEDQP